MQEQTEYSDLWRHVLGKLEQSLCLAYDAGVDLRRLVIEPGIGFGKGLQENLTLIANVNRLWAVGRPSLLGLSRKRFLGDVTGKDVGERMVSTMAAISIGVLQGCAIMRVHDAGAAVDAVRVAAALRDHRSG